MKLNQNSAPLYIVVTHCWSWQEWEGRHDPL